MFEDGTDELREFPNYIATERVIPAMKESTSSQINQEYDINPDLICPICSNILINPQDCVQCDTSFCELCIKDFIFRNI